MTRTSIQIQDETRMKLRQSIKQNNKNETTDQAINRLLKIEHIVKKLSELW